ncbi:hypothetical protein [Streptosporangium subroseum]|uniref:hypothetical protein n=1 Tax=Streptosporangium subroseum TaxID=106412 RepID=UPI00308DAF35|nr:hypothetical protein OHB15_23760 [Streptosporangium subroseum]
MIFSGFVAEAAAAGARAPAADPLYARGAADLAERLPLDLEQATVMIAANADRFVWEWYGSARRHREMRLNAGSAFVADLRRDPAPTLPPACRTCHSPTEAPTWCSARTCCSPGPGGSARSGTGRRSRR